MKLFAAVAIVLLATSQSTAFQVGPSRVYPASSALYAEYEVMEGEGKINLKIDLDSPKVATMVSLESVYESIEDMFWALEVQGGNVTDFLLNPFFQTMTG
jgi:hypothetical protein